MVALKAIASLGIDPIKLSKIVFLEKMTCENGVPATEVARVLTDGVMPPAAMNALIKEMTPKLDEPVTGKDVEGMVSVYNNLKLKTNIPTEIIEFVEKNLIQVIKQLFVCLPHFATSGSVFSGGCRRQHDFVALCSWGEAGRYHWKGAGSPPKIICFFFQLAETMKATGATACVAATTLMPPLVEMTGEKEPALCRIIGRNLKEAGYESRLFLLFYKI